MVIPFRLDNFQLVCGSYISKQRKAMRPLLRHVSRPVVESIFAPAIPSAKSLAHKTGFSHDLKPAICIQCRLRAHSRPYSDSNKPPPYKVTKSTESAHPSPSLSVKDAAESASSLPKPAKSSSISNDGTAHTQRQNLPSQEEQRRSHIAKRFSHVMDNLQSNIFIAGKRLNDLTGYSGIEVMKKEIEEQGTSCIAIIKPSSSDMSVRGACPQY